MKIAIFAATSGHSGVDRIISNLCLGISQHGIAVDLLKIRNHGPYINPIPDGVHIVDLGVSHGYSSLFPLVRYLRREKPAVLLTDKDKINRLAILARMLARVPTKNAVRIGTTISSNLARRSFLRRYGQYSSIRLLYRFADTIITPSKGAAEDLARIAHLPPERVSVLPSPIIDDAFFAKSNEPLSHTWFLPNSPPVIVGVGELCERKDFATLLKAFAVVRQRKEARLLILGEGRKRVELENLARQLGIVEHVSMPGFVANPYPYIRRASVFVLASRAEGLGLALLEALALGVPCVATDCPSGPREILQEGRLGILVPVGDYNILAQAILTSLDQGCEGQKNAMDALSSYHVTQASRAYLQAMGFAPLIESHIVEHVDCRLIAS
jgi:glycosyltransferase involved in cell wall biosynthesis